MKASPPFLRRAAAVLALLGALPGAAMAMAPAPAPAPKAATPVAKTESEVRRVGPEEARRMVEAGQALIIDVRAADSFAAEHIAGAKSFPEGQILERRGELPHDKLVIAYCS
jgi:3-mercaptopyruvate sulfurtransferase SseA